jgi:hypothetical protein
MSLVEYLEEVGLKRGLRKAIALGLDLKFGRDGLALLPRVEKIEELDRLLAICDAIKPARSIDDVRLFIPDPT